MNPRPALGRDAQSGEQLVIGPLVALSVGAAPSGPSLAGASGPGPASGHHLLPRRLDRIRSSGGR